MASYNHFEVFTLDLGQGSHQLHAAGHTLEVYLTNAAPSTSADSIKTDLAEITPENGYTGAADAQNDFTETTGTGTLTCVDIVFTASGGSFGPAQYAVLFNETQTSPVDPLIAWWDYGSSETVLDGETFTVDFAASTLVITQT